MFRKMATAAVIAIAIAGPAWADDCSDRPGSLTCDEELRAAAELGISTGQVLAWTRAAYAAGVDVHLFIRSITQLKEGYENAAEKEKDLAIDGAKMGAAPYREPGAISLCPPPHRMTDNGCK